MTQYTILDENQNPLATVEGDRVAVQAVIVVSPQAGAWNAAETERIAQAFRAYGVYAVVVGEPVNVVQVLQPGE